ncbi:oleate hydratase [Phenylobacterium aquaticum]|uniref:oleate hydratase n=1 Tax=Phenylobacterium aquaticum TaxID=1763816 RepID=UPI001F5D2834|nr:oleate hydratase [Phenylobacterium aquaticum]MCI3135571.1 oleate hydratase [Phenylobacterium aquaticum]
MSKPDRTETHAHLIGGGIASLAAAAVLIRDGDLIGRNITIYEELDRLGGSLDGAGDPQAGYMVRGGRMIEAKYLCTYDLFSSIPTLDGKQTVTQEIFQWNEIIKTGSKSRLIRDGGKIDAPEFGLTEAQILTIEKLVAEPEFLLGDSRISDHFEPAFFRTNFWFMWATTFAFQPWHSAVELKRYFIRFTHMVAGFSELRGIMRTVLNQYDSLVLPLRKWLEERGVRFELGTQVTDLGFTESDGRQAVASIAYVRGGQAGEVAVGEGDLVIATLGSMTEGSSIGAMDRAPALNDKRVGGAWTLWETIAEGRPELGRPAAFADHVAESKWVSFTTTLKSTAFFDLVRDFTGNVPGEGGLITFADSPWLMSIVLPHQPHFIGQPADVQVFWGYALNVDVPGAFVDKPMSACTGAEIMTELLGQLGVAHRTDEILGQAICLPCMMPFITSQFLARAKGDRPQILPKGYANLAIVGQFCEQPQDVVFTVEYSVRAAMTAAYGLLGLDRKPPAVFDGQLDPRNLYKAFRALHDLRL